MIFTEKVIEVDILDINDLLQRHNRKKVSKDLIDYVITEVPHFRKEDNLKIVINSNLEENINCTKLIKQGLENEYEKSCKRHIRIGTIQLIYLIFGVLILFISTLIDAEVFREVVLICGWVLIWGMVELEISSDMEGRKKRKTLKKLINSEFIENKI